MHEREDEFQAAFVDGTPLDLDTEEGSYR